MKTLLAFIFLLSAVLSSSSGQNSYNEGDFTLKTQNYFSNKTIYFEENQGQFINSKGKVREEILYRGKAPGVEIFLTEEGLTFYLVDLKKNKKIVNDFEFGYEKTRITSLVRFDIKPKNASILKKNIKAVGERGNKINYYDQHNPEGVKNVRLFSKLIVQNIYPNIDWIIYNNGNEGIKYDFEVRPGADIEQLKLIYEGAGKLSQEGQTLKITTPLGAINEGELYAYSKGSNTGISCTYQLNTLSETHDTFAAGEKAKNTYEVGYKLTNSNISETIIIDPPLTWCTMYTGNDIVGPRAITADQSGNVFVCGYTFALDLPLLDAGVYFDSTHYNSTTGVGNDIFILKFDINANLLWATYYGGEASDQPNDLNVDVFGNLYLVGQTFSEFFPLQDATKFFDSNNASSADAFILKFDNNGNRLWATFYGYNSGLEKATAVVTDSLGYVFVTGSAQDSKFKIMSGAYNQDSIAGQKDAFILRFSPTTVLNWATFYGGTLNDDGKDITIDSDGNIIVVGYTNSTDFPLYDAGQGSYHDSIQSGGKDAFMLKFNSSGARIWSTLFGGSGDEEARAVVCDSERNIWVSGYTKSSDMDTLDAGLGGYYKSTIGGLSDVFLMKFNDSNMMQFSTYVGGSGAESDNLIVATAVEKLVIDACDNIYFSYHTRSADCFTVDPGNGAYYKAVGASIDMILSRLTNDGAVQWATYFGGSVGNFRGPIAVNPIDGSLWLGTEFAGYDSASIATAPLIDPGGGAFFDTNYNLKDNGAIARFGFEIQSNLTAPYDACDGDSSWVSPTGGITYTYLWSDGSTDTITLLPSGSHTVMITDTVLCLTITDSLVIMPCNIIVSDTFICEGDSVLLVASGASSYNWVDSATFTPVLSTDSTYMAKPVITTTYAVYNPGDTAYLTVTVMPSSSISRYDTICQGDSVQLPGGAYTGIAGIFTDSFSTVSGCDSVFITTLTVDTAFDAAITPVNAICANTGLLMLTAADGGGAWSGTGITNADSGYFDPSLAGAGTHEIIYTIGGSCGDSDTINISVYEVPSLSLWAVDESCEGENDGSVELTITGGATPYAYLWNDVGSSTTQDLAALNPGGYTVIVTDSNSCEVTDNIVILASSTKCFTPYVYVPNIFSPNGDGENDKLFVQGKGIQEIIFIIYDRWGENIFETNDQGTGWDGTYKGKAMNEAVFVYYLKVAFNDESIVEKKGNLTLVR